MQAEKVQRKYALTKLASGDYLLPSNDRSTLWRIYSYEDGPSHGLDDMPRDRMFWGLRRWYIPADVPPRHVDDIDNWDLWPLHSDLYEKRQDAIDVAVGVRRVA